MNLVVRLLFWIPAVVSFEVWCPQCTWQVEVHEIGKKHEKKVSFIDDKYQVHQSINDMLANWDWTLKEEAKPIDYIPYSYVLLLTLPDPELTRRIIQYGLHPEIELLYRPNSQGSNPFVFTLPASLTDWPDFHGDADCEEEYCELAWVTPLPVSDEFVIEGKITSSGISHMMPDERFTLGTSLFAHLTPQDADEFNIASVLENVDQIPLNYIFGVSTSKVIPLLDGDKHVLVISKDDFNTWALLKVDESIFEEDKRAGECCDGVVQFDAAAISHRMLFQLTHGVYELRERSDNDSSEVIEKQLGICTRNLMLPSNAYSHHQYALVEGACGNEGEIYVTHLKNTIGISHTFKYLHDMDGRHVCECLTEILTCSIVTTAVSARHKGSALVLLHVTKNSGIEEYKLMEIFFSNMEWILLSTIQKWIALSREKSTSSRPYLVSENMQTHSSEESKVELKLKGIALTPWLSPNIVVWGNMILKSPDFAKNFYIYSKEINVTQLEITVAGSVIALTKSGQIYCTSISTSALVQIYPSSNWNIFHSLSESLHDMDINFKILSIFLNSHGHGQMLLFYKGTLKSVSIPVQDILALDEMQKALKTEISLVLRSEDYYVGLDYCPYSDITIFLQQPKTRTKVKSFRFAEPLLSSRDHVHKNTSFLVLSALIRNFQYWSSVYNAQTYTSDYDCTCDEWAKLYQYNQEYNHYLYQNKLQYDGVQFTFDGYQCETNLKEISLSKLPRALYLDQDEILSFEVELHENIHYGLKKHHGSDLNSMDLSAIVSDPSIVSIKTERHDNLADLQSTFKISIHENQPVENQHPPGHELYPVSVGLCAWNAPMHCFERISWSETIDMGLYASDIMFGCPPNLRLTFDWKAAWNRSDTQDVREQPFDCLYPDPKLPCFYFHNGFYPVFAILDESLNEFYNYEGNFTLKIIGGSPNSEDDIKLFNETDVFHYNNLNSQIPGKIWGPIEDTDLYDGWPVFTKNNSALSWFCQPSSPCANILPKVPDNPDYYFLVEFSNRDVDSSSYCDFTFRFVVHVFGLPADAIKTALVIIMVSSGILSLIALVYFIFNNQENKHTRKLNKWWRRKLKKKNRVEAEEMGDLLSPAEELERWRQNFTPQLPEKTGQDTQHSENKNHGSTDDTKSLDSFDALREKPTTDGTTKMNRKSSHAAKEYQAKNSSASDRYRHSACSQHNNTNGEEADPLFSSPAADLSIDSINMQQSPINATHFKPFREKQLESFEEQSIEIIDPSKFDTEVPLSSRSLNISETGTLAFEPSEEPPSPPLAKKSEKQNVRITTGSFEFPENFNLSDEDQPGELSHLKSPSRASNYSRHSAKDEEEEPGTPIGRLPRIEHKYTSHLMPGPLPKLSTWHPSLSMQNKDKGELI